MHQFCYTIDGFSSGSFAHFADDPGHNWQCCTVGCVGKQEMERDLCGCTAGYLNALRSVADSGNERLQHYRCLKGRIAHSFLDAVNHGE